MSDLITASNLGVRYNEQVVLDNASLTIHEGEHVGLVGRNGSGKSTFLKILAGQMSPDTGNVSGRRDLVISYLSQDFTLDTSKNVYESEMVVRSRGASALTRNTTGISRDSPGCSVWSVKQKHSVFRMYCAAPAGAVFMIACAVTGRSRSFTTL